jgi:site-specific DNA-methyltransferase (adenine-specific)
MEWTNEITVTNEDNMKMMGRYEDNYFDLAIVDPPYGLGKRTTDGGTKKNSQVKFMSDILRTNWDNEIPNNNYFTELKRVSKNQIIWGGNYFSFLWKKGCRGLITWDKMVYIPTMSQIEYAWVSFDILPKLIKINNNDKNRKHPTQKPVKLYKWLLQNYAKPHDKILDTHLGSGSIALACHELNFELTACELDEQYYNDSHKRFKLETAQLSIF